MIVKLDVKRKINGCRGRVGLLLLSGVFAGVVEVFALARFMVYFWGNQGQRVSKAGPLPSQSSGQSHSPVKWVGERQRLQPDNQHHRKPPARQHNPQPPPCVGQCGCGAETWAGPGESLQLPQHSPTAQIPHLGLRPNQPLWDTNSQANPQCRVRSRTNLHDPAMTVPHKVLLTPNTAERLKTLHS